MRMILGLGTNVGDRLRNLRQAVRALRSFEQHDLFRVQAVSPIYESDAMLAEGASRDWDQPFLNLAVQVDAKLGPEAVLSRVKEIERSLGRQARGRWAPREIDIDILAADGVAVKTERLEIPHPGLLQRPFALLPLSDLVPDWIYPIGEAQGRSARELSASWRVADPEIVPFRARRTTDHLAEIVGILNLTPDSFSDGGFHSETASAVARALELISAGATVLDLGAESTRPGATGVDAEAEWRRLAPVLEALPRGRAMISVDTRHPETAARSIRAGVSWINDVIGGADPEMRGRVADSGVDFVFMHSLGVPPSGERVLPRDRDPVDLLLRWAEERITLLARDGIDRARLIFDPGVGFGKTAEQSLQILREARRFQELGVRVLIGHSRKSFMGKWVPGDPPNRDLETALISWRLARQGVDYLRVHDVRITARSLRVGALIDGAGGC